MRAAENGWALKNANPTYVMEILYTNAQIGDPRSNPSEAGR
jgi:hypothetical protein